MTREEAITAVKEVTEMSLPWDDRHYEALQMAIKALEEQPQRKTGKWIELDCDEDKYDEIKCSCCKKTFVVDAYHWTDIGFVKDDFRFCPNCGADMRGNGE